jgi:hypothetical protein
LLFLFEPWKLDKVSSTQLHTPDDKRQKIFLDVVLPLIAAATFGWPIILILGFLTPHWGYHIFWTEALGPGSLIILLVVLLTMILFKGRTWARWLIVFFEIIITGILAISFVGWRSPQLQFRHFINPIPSSVVIREAYFIQAGPDPMSWVHFSASPEVMDEIIRRNELEESARRHPNDAGFVPFGPKWWNPESLKSPQLFISRHDGPPPWKIGIWVNENKTEAFGFLD